MRLKGQAHIMEYFFLAFFVLLVIVLLVLFLTGWQFTTTSSRQSEARYQQSMYYLKAFTNTPLINREIFSEGSMLEDSKLTALSCEDVEELFGEKVFAEVRIPGYDLECTADNYPLCGYWSYCKETGNMIAYDVPVNVYRKTTGDIEIGILTVGVYE
jgi:hypothetical protein